MAEAKQAVEKQMQCHIKTVLQETSHTIQDKDEKCMFSCKLMTKNIFYIQ